MFRRMLDDSGNTLYRLTDATSVPEVAAWIARPVGWGEAPCFFGASAHGAVQKLNRHYSTSAVPFDRETADLEASAEPPAGFTKLTREDARKFRDAYCSVAGGSPHGLAAISK